MGKIDRLKAAYDAADSEGKKYLAESNTKDYVASTIATIKMNAQTYIKGQLKEAIGRAVIEGEE